MPGAGSPGRYVWGKKTPKTCQVQCRVAREGEWGSGSGAVHACRARIMKTIIVGRHATPTAFHSLTDRAGYKQVIPPGLRFGGWHAWDRLARRTIEAKVNAVGVPCL